ncbi:MAG TPA: hypothetical protein VGG73_02995 [Vicinamibacterales bacterium]
MRSLVATMICVVAGFSRPSSIAMVPAVEVRLKADTTDDHAGTSPRQQVVYVSAA